MAPFHFFKALILLQKNISKQTGKYDDRILTVGETAFLNAWWVENNGFKLLNDLSDLFFSTERAKPISEVSCGTLIATIARLEFTGVLRKRSPWIFSPGRLNLNAQGEALLVAICLSLNADSVSDVERANFFRVSNFFLKLVHFAEDFQYVNLAQLAGRLTARLEKMMRVSLKDEDLRVNDSEEFNLREMDCQVNQLIVLYQDGVIGRAYLQSLRLLGVRPVCIIEIIPKRSPFDNRLYGRYLPGFLKRDFAKFRFAEEIFHWPRQFEIDYRQSVNDVWLKLVDFEPRLSQITPMCQDSPICIQDYSDNVIPLFVHGINDPKVVETLNSIAGSLVLFTGGGIVSDTFLSRTNKPLMHIHPAVLPEIRGCDGILWNYLIRGTVGATCLNLSKQIDAGDILFTQEWESSYLMKGVFDKVEISDRYRFLYSFVDPWVRAACLIAYIERHRLRPALGESQADRLDASYYPFMEFELWARVINSMNAGAIHRKLNPS